MSISSVANMASREGEHVPGAEDGEPTGSPVKIGDAVFIHCVMRSLVGRVAGFRKLGNEHFIFLNEASMSYHTGDTEDMLTKGVFIKSEILPGGAYVNTASIVDILPYGAKLPTKSTD